MDPPVSPRSPLIPQIRYPCKLLYTSGTSPKNPKFPCTERRRPQGLPFGTLHPSLPTARLDDSQNHAVLFDKQEGRLPPRGMHRGLRNPTQLSAEPGTGADGDDSRWHGFTHEPPYEGLSAAIWTSQTDLQRWHSDRRAGGTAFSVMKSGERRMQLARLEETKQTDQFPQGNQTASGAPVTPGGHSPKGPPVRKETHGQTLEDRRRPRDDRAQPGQRLQDGC